MCVHVYVCMHIACVCNSEDTFWGLFLEIHCGVWDSNSRKGLQDNPFLPAEPSHWNSRSDLFHLA